MLKFVKSALATRTGKDTYIVFSTTLMNVIAGGLFFVFAPRILGRFNYGLFSTVISTTLLISAIANFGIDSAILKFANYKNF